MDYYLIGQRIRKFRKARGLSQEQLAESVNISVTHMSHIETGNTKLSLPVLADIAVALGVCTDELIFEHPELRSAIDRDIFETIEGCTEKQLKIIADVIRSVKSSMDKYDS